MTTSSQTLAFGKKGWSSQSTTKPSLKVKFSEYGQTETHASLDRFALNNNKSDDTNLRQCFAYRMMDKAGLPTPRCTFAKVKVNDQQMGVYTIVEEIKEPFLKRVFGSSHGNLYEGGSSDFRDSFMGFEQDIGHDASMNDLVSIKELLESITPETSLGDIDTKINLDAFYTFWAAEVMLWHRDGTRQHQ